MKPHQQTSSAGRFDDPILDTKATELKPKNMDPPQREILDMDAKKADIEKSCDMAEANGIEAHTKSFTPSAGSVNAVDEDLKTVASQESENADGRTVELQQSVQRIDAKLNNWESQWLEAGFLHADPEWTPKTEQEKRSPAIPELLCADWKDFKHKADKGKRYAVEVLKGKAKYYYERQEEEMKHRVHMAKLKRGSVEVPEENANLQHDAWTGEELPERIRINSTPILAILGNIDSAEQWTEQSAVVLRPFKPLVYYGHQIRSTLQSLEAEWGEAEKEARLKDPEDNPATSTDPVNSQRNASEVVAETDLSANEKLLNPSPEDHLNEGSTGENCSKTIEEHAKQDDSADKEHSDMGEDDLSKDEPEDPANSIEALRDLRCLVEFMDKYLDPVVAQYKSNDRKTVSFNDLWHLFKPGDLIYGPLGSRAATDVSIDIEDYIKISSPKDVDRYQEVWKVVSTADGRANLRAEENSDDEDQVLLRHDGNTESEGPGLRVNPFRIMTYHVDFNGSTFLPGSSQFNIHPFQGYREITSLSIYPLRFAKNQTDLRSKWLKRGKRFRELATPQHLYYEGRSITHRPDGYQSKDDIFPKYSGNIDSEVVVDFKEALSVHPEWKNQMQYFVTMKSILKREFSENFPIYYWSEGRQPKLVSKEFEYYYIDRRIDEKMMESAREQDGLTKDIRDKALEEDWKLGDEHLILLPNRVYAFVMKIREFGRYLRYSVQICCTITKRKTALVSVDGLRAVHTDRNGFNDLKLQAGHKEILASLVSEHFRKKANKNYNQDTSYDSDIVRGKGKGLIVLLHGAPGVGKTSTAECIAEEYRKPLFPVTCGDLGLTAFDVERELQGKFHLAELWDCVLLLDEADVFLAERTRHDLQRNSLVSVFLRVMEYFTGILFLTTNRVGSFDEAFKSRIHLSLYYPPLDWPQSKGIWEVNLKRLKDTKNRRNEPVKIDEADIFAYASSQFEETRRRKRQWNGRQIRNAFQIASALAEYEAYDVRPETEKVGPPLQPHLKVKHFETVARASTEFDEYLYKTRGVSFSRAALQGSLRNDEYSSNNSTPIYYRQQRPSMPTAFATPSAGRHAQTHAGVGPQQRYWQSPQPYSDSRVQDGENEHPRTGMVEGGFDDGSLGQSYDNRSHWPMADDYDGVEAPAAMGKFGRNASPVPRPRGQARDGGGSYIPRYGGEYYEDPSLH